MKIEKGKFYRTRAGRKVEILKTDAKNMRPIVGLVTLSEGREVCAQWSDNGIYLKSDQGNSDDIIGEWGEALDFDPNCLPKWADKWVAMDEDGCWYCYSEKPEIKSSHRIHLSRGNDTKIPEDFTPKNYKGNWEDSLFNVEQLKINKSCQYK